MRRRPRRLPALHLAFDDDGPFSLTWAPGHVWLAGDRGSLAIRAPWLGAEAGLATLPAMTDDDLLCLSDARGRFDPALTTAAVVAQANAGAVALARRVGRRAALAPFPERPGFALQKDTYGRNASLDGLYDIPTEWWGWVSVWRATLGATFHPDDGDTHPHDVLTAWRRRDLADALLRRLADARDPAGFLSRLSVPDASPRRSWTPAERAMAATVRAGIALGHP